MQPSPVAVDVVRVSRGPMRLAVRDDGRTRVRERYVISTPVSGRLLRIDLEPGDPVVGTETMVAVIQPTDPQLLDPRAVAELKARELAADARLQQLAPKKTIARETLTHAEVELSRIRALFEQNALDKDSVDDAELAFAVAQGEYADTEFLEQIATFELQQAQAALLQTSGEADATQKVQFPIKAPVSGTVLRVFRESATVVLAGEPLLEIGDAGDLEVEVDVLSSDAVRVSPGANVLLDDWGGDHVILGRVRRIEPAAFTKVSALGVEEQRVNVIIDLPDKTELHGLGDGYRVEASIEIWAGENVLQVPVGSLFREGAKASAGGGVETELSWTVYAVRQGRAQRQQVRIGHRNDDTAEVLDGLSEGDSVIRHPGDQVRQGIKIEDRRSGIP